MSRLEVWLFEGGFGGFRVLSAGIYIWGSVALIFGFWFRGLCY